MNYKTKSEKRKLRPDNLIIVLDDLDFSWESEEVESARNMWEEGTSVADMAKVLRPHDYPSTAIDEVALLVMHLRRANKIKLRKRGAC